MDRRLYFFIATIGTIGSKQIKIKPAYLISRSVGEEIFIIILIIILLKFL